MTHDDEYESEWADVPTGAEGPISEDALGRHLIRRGAGAAPSGLAAAIAARVAETKREPGWRRTARSLRPAAAIAAFLVVVLIGGLIATAKPATDGGPGTSSFDPATRPMTVAELVRYVAGGTAAGKTVIVDDRIDDSGLLVSCATADDCPFGVLAGYGASTGRASDESAWVFPADPRYPPDGSPIAGPLALRIRATGGFTLLGRVGAKSSTGLAWSVAGVPSPTVPLEVTLIHGWLGATSIQPPCAPSLTSTSLTGLDGAALDFGCGQISFLTDAPVTSETTLAAGAIRVQNDGYSWFGGPKPGESPSNGLIQPRDGTYLVRLAQESPDCVHASGSPMPCFGANIRLGQYWELIARLDPVTIPAATTAGPAAIPSPSPTPAGPLWDPTQRPLTPPEFLRVLDSRPAPGTVFIVDDQIVPAAAFCPSLGPCPNGTLQNAPVLVLPPTGGTLTFTTDSSTSTPFIGGPLAIQVGLGPFPIFLGTVVSSGQRLAVTAHDLAARNGTGGLFVVPAWIVAGASPSCPSFVPVPEPTSDVGLGPPPYDCYATQWLTDTKEQPQHVVQTGDSTDISITPPSDGLEIQPGAYQSFAPDPADDGHLSYIPRQGVFLVRDWAGRGEILARLDPVAIPTDVPPTLGVEGTPIPTDLMLPSDVPTDPPASPIGSIVWPKDELVSQVLSGTIPQGTVVVTTLADSDLTPAVGAGTVRTCTLMCPQWYLGTVDHAVTIYVSKLSPEPNAHTGRVAFVVNGGSLRLLGRATAQPQGPPLTLSEVAFGNSDVLAVHAWLRNGPALPCPSVAASEPILGLDQKVLTYGCSGTWLEPGPDDPDASPGAAVGSFMQPGSVRVQDGADGSGPTAREGTFLVRWLGCTYPTHGCDSLLGHFDDFELIGEVAFPAGP